MPRQNFLLSCEQTFYSIPRASATLYAKDNRDEGQSLPLTPLVSPGEDPTHRSFARVRGRETDRATGQTQQRGGGSQARYDQRGRQAWPHASPQSCAGRRTA
ncbi:hypothetical protein [Deinococcus hopiensis]|uniref:hypothetical protein n=1 Tax=Deinococcus hopiensis TaxID=309885 RepID=UPI000A006E00|nr:hypothetical protein [Deinococcus hopiensis]